MSDPSPFLDLARVLGVLCTAFTGLIVARAAIAPWWPLAWQLTAGAVLGAAAVLAINLPIVVAPGIGVDARAAILVWAAPVGGWPAALAAGAVAVGHGLSTGGPGVVGSVFVAGAAIALGAGLAWHLRRRGAVPGPRHVALAAVGVGLVPVAAALLIRPFDVGIGAMLRTLMIDGGLTVGSALILGGLIVFEERRRAAPDRRVDAIAAPAGAAAPVDTMSPETPDARAPVPARSPAGRRVLVAEDTAMNREVLALLLRGDGHDVVEVADGTAAVAAATARDIDVVVMDLRMPGLDGVEATRRIRAFDPATPILILTGDVRPEAAAAARAAGADAVLVKPFDPAELSATIATAARRGADPNSAGDRQRPPDAGAPARPAGPSSVRSLASALGAERAAALVADARSDTLARLDRIDAAVSRGDDLASVRGPAHELIGPAGIVAGSPAASAARALEDAARAGDRAGATAQAAILRGLVEATRGLEKEGPRDEGGGDTGWDRAPRAVGRAVP